MADMHSPTLYQINTRVWLTELSSTLRKPATLDDIADAELDHLAGLGFDWVWLLSVWQTGPAAQAISRANPQWNNEFAETLPDLKNEDIAGSGFAIQSYTVLKELGGAAALARLRQRLQQRNIKLMLDFVPNHMAPDHPWVNEHPEFFVSGNEDDLARSPQNYCLVQTQNGPRIFAYGRDPYFDGWPDTLQLNYGNMDLHHAMLGELKTIAGLCDGVRCDMAMLVLPEIFAKTWNIPMQPFWPTATQQVRELVPGFTFMAEVYWDLEWTLQQQGFDYTYDKRLYDRLRERHTRPVREHLQAGLEFQYRSVRFLENHDEPRAATALLPQVHEAAAVITFLSPGLRFFHQGQFEGRRKRISPHLVRGPKEQNDQRLEEFYNRLLTVLRQPAVRDGSWQLLERLPAWEGNWTTECFVACCWNGMDGRKYVIAVNYADHQSQCFLAIPWPELAGHQWLLVDQMTPAQFKRNGNDLLTHGLFLDMPAWSYHVFALHGQN
jgi:glycosidase